MRERYEFYLYLGLIIAHITQTLIYLHSFTELFHKDLSVVVKTDMGIQKLIYLHLFTQLFLKDFSLVIRTNIMVEFLSTLPRGIPERVSTANP